VQNSVDLSLVVGVYAVVIGASWGILVDPLRPASYGVAAASVALTGFLIAGLAPAAVASAPVLVVAFSATAFVRDRWWHRNLLRKEQTPRTPPPPPPSASATG
jgi:hypothetical protein